MQKTYIIVINKPHSGVVETVHSIEENTINERDQPVHTRPEGFYHDGWIVVVSPNMPGRRAIITLVCVVFGPENRIAGNEDWSILSGSFLAFLKCTFDLAHELGFDQSFGLM
jgi:hypothetical protein